jgi:phosphopantothenoylcysteine decarboxylase/phosphopantothenate--cysteine ligase
MRTAVHDCFTRRGADIYVSAAAVSDFAPQKTDGKIPSGTPARLDLEPLPKLLDEVVTRYSPKTIAFKLGRNQEKKGKEMIATGDIDMVLVNSPETMGSARGDYIIITRSDTSAVSGTKEEIAAAIWKKWDSNVSV